jgi:hypothetical protein
MQSEYPDFFILKSTCHLCGTNLCATWNMTVSGLPLAQAWSVQCDNVHCNYVYPAQFRDLEALSAQFEALD